MPKYRLEVIFVAGAGDCYSREADSSRQQCQRGHDVPDDADDAASDVQERPERHPHQVHGRAQCYDGRTRRVREQTYDHGWQWCCSRRGPARSCSPWHLHGQRRPVWRGHVLGSGVSLPIWKTNRPIYAQRRRTNQTQSAHSVQNGVASRPPFCVRWVDCFALCVACAPEWDYVNRSTNAAP